MVERKGSTQKEERQEQSFPSAGVEGAGGQAAFALVAGAEVGSSLGQGAGGWGSDLSAADGEVFQQLPGSAVCG